MASFRLSVVVPANAGTHNHKCRLLEKKPSIISLNNLAAAYGSRLEAGTTAEYAFSFSRREAPEVLISLPSKNSEGAGKTG